MNNSDDIRRLGDDLRSDFKFLEVMDACLKAVEEHLKLDPPAA